MLAWMLLGLMFGRGDLGTRETRAVDLIELSHVGSSVETVVYHQIILWRIDPVDGQYHTVGWRMCHPATGVIERMGPLWMVRGVGDTERVRFVARDFRESWSATDPEQEDRRRYWRGDAPNMFNKQQRPPVVIEAAEMEGER
jgi:hypothetical protein